jgi:hypothetical protein
MEWAWAMLGALAFSIACWVLIFRGLARLLGART